MKCPIVEEVQKARMEHTRKFHGDLSAIFDDLRAHQKTCGHKIVRLPPRKLHTAEDAEDIAAFDETAAESDLPFDQVAEGLKRSGKI